MAVALEMRDPDMGMEVLIPFELRSFVDPIIAITISDTL
jgi:hypothetical protein